MTLYLEKDLQFACASGRRSVVACWVFVKWWKGRGGVSEIGGLEGSCNTRCEPVRLNTRGEEVAGGRLRCVRVLFTPTQLHPPVFCAQGWNHAWANLEFTLCSNCSLTYQLPWNKFAFSTQSSNGTAVYTRLFTAALCHGGKMWGPSKENWLNILYVLVCNILAMWL